MVSPVRMSAGSGIGLAAAILSAALTLSCGNECTCNCSCDSRDFATSFDTDPGGCTVSVCRTRCTQQGLAATNVIAICLD